METKNFAICVGGFSANKNYSKMGEFVVSKKASENNIKKAIRKQLEKYYFKPIIKDIKFVYTVSDATFSCEKLIKWEIIK